MKATDRTHAALRILREARRRIAKGKCRTVGFAVFCSAPYSSLLEDMDKCIPAASEFHTKADRLAFLDNWIAAHEALIRGSEHE